MLLYCGTLTADGPSNIAAIRFATAVQVSSIKIFPSGSSPFACESDQVAETEPPTFFLDLYFNAQPIVSQDVSATPKPKASNALVCTSLSYVGGQREFLVNWDSKFVTRLMIVQGGFQTATIAVYGSAIADVSQDCPQDEVIPTALSEVDTLRVSSALDPAHSLDPTRLARHLLSLTPCPASLTTVIRLIFCIKPRKEEWDLAGFPKYVDLETKPTSIDELCEMLSKPIPENAPSELGAQFCASIKDILYNEHDDDGTWRSTAIALLCCQPSDIASSVLKAPHLSDLIQGDLSLEALSILTNAVVQPDLAVALNNESFLCNLQRIHFSELRTSLESQIANCVDFDTFLSSRTGDQSAAALWVRNICSSEQSLGIWLLSMIEQPSRVMSLSEFPLTNIKIFSNGPFRSSAEGTKSNDILGVEGFVAFLRGYIGVASILAVFAWADSIADESCVTRTLGILRLWQNNEDYESIVNHLLSLPQFTVRLERLLERNSNPSQAVVLAEEILSALLDNPETLLNDDVSYTVRSLPSLCLSIGEDQRLSMVTLAELADGGIQQATETLAKWIGPAHERETMTPLLLSLMILRNKLHHNLEDELVEGFRSLASQRALSSLMAVLDILAVELCRLAYDGHSSPVDAMCYTYLVVACNITAELIRYLVVSKFATEVDIPVIARRMVTCLCAIQTLQDQDGEHNLRMTGLRKSTMDVCVSTLHLVCGMRDGTVEHHLHWTAAVKGIFTEAHSTLLAFRDPSAHISLVVAVLVRLISANDGERIRSHPEGRSWICSALPTLLPTLATLWKHLCVKDKVALANHLMALESGQLGLKEWFISEELEFISKMLDILSSLVISEVRQSILEQQIENSFQFLLEISQLPTGGFTDLASDQSLASLQSLTECLHKLCSAGVSSPSAGRLVSKLRPRYTASDSELPFLGVRVLLQASLVDNSLMPSTALHLDDSPATEICQAAIAQDTEKLFRNLFINDLIRHDPEQSKAIIKLAQWYTTKGFAFPHIEKVWFTELITHCTRQATLTSLDIDALLSTTQFARDGSDEDEMLVDVERAPNKPLTLFELCQLLEPAIHSPSTPRDSSALSGHEAVVIATISPNSSILRSPFASLAKTYTGDSFRQLRQEAYRQNTSRLPSLHVDAFEAGGSPTPTRLTHNPALSSPLISANVTMPAIQHHLVHLPDYPTFPSL